MTLTLRRETLCVNITHCVKLLPAFTERSTGKRAHVQLPNKLVKKGAPGPPEAVEEVGEHIQSRVGDGAILCTDKAHAWKKTARDYLGGTVPVASAAHSKGQYTNAVAFPVKTLTTKLKNLAVLRRPAANTLRVVGGDQREEATFGAVKKRMRKKNVENSREHPGAHYLACAWLLRNPGVEGVSKAAKLYLDAHLDKVDPKTVYTGRQSEADRDSA